MMSGVTNNQLMQQLVIIKETYEDKFAKLNKFVIGRCVHLEQENKFIAAESSMLKKEFDELRMRCNKMSEELHHAKNEIMKLKEKDDEIDNPSVNENHNTNTKIIPNSVNLQSSITNINENLFAVKSDVNCLKQKNMFNDVIITGLPELENENLLEKVNEILDQYGTKIKDDEVKQIYRLKPNKTDLNTPVLIELKDENMKCFILEKQRKMGPVLLQSVYKNLPSTDFRKIFFKHRLTKENLILLREARRFGKEHNYQYVWTSNNLKVLMKKEATSQIIEITSLNDIQKLKREHLDSSYLF